MATQVRTKQGRTIIRHGAFAVIDSGDQIRIDVQDRASLNIPKRAWQAIVDKWQSSKEQSRRKK